MLTLGDHCRVLPRSPCFRLRVLSLLHVLCSLCLDFGAKAEFEASLGNGFSSPCFARGPSRQVCLGVMVGETGGAGQGLHSREPLGLGAGGRLQRAQGLQWGVVSTVTSDFS